MNVSHFNFGHLHLSYQQKFVEYAIGVLLIDDARVTAIILSGSSELDKVL